MKAFFLIFILLTFSACKTKTESITHHPVKLMKTECPKEGECSILLLENKQLVLKTEETTGNIYPEVTNGSSLVVVFSYSENAPKGIVDGNYTETIHFEIPKEFSELNKKNYELRSEEHTSELQSRGHLVCRLLLEKKKKNQTKKNTQNVECRSKVLSGTRK